MQLFTIGHSTHEADQLVRLLALHDVTAVGDVRSHPYSGRASQFNRENLSETLRQAGIEYVFLGDQLGSRSPDPDCYIDSQVSYGQVAKSQRFIEGIERVLKGLQQYSIALLCAEKDPLFCHRTILVCRQLESYSVAIAHILSDGSLETQQALEQRLLRTCGLEEPSMFSTRVELLERAYDMQGKRIAYVRPDVGAEERLPEQI